MLYTLVDRVFHLPLCLKVLFIEFRVQSFKCWDIILLSSWGFLMTASQVKIY
jgi:hypothetical protein